MLGVKTNLKMSYFTKEDYYFDIDLLNQFRLTGPGNHLLLGLGFEPEVKVEVEEYEVKGEGLTIKLKTNMAKLNLGWPLVCDIRTLRSLTEGVRPRPSYRELGTEGSMVVPQNLNQFERDGHQVLRFENKYLENETEFFYGSELVFDKNLKVELIDRNIVVKGSSDISFEVVAIGNVEVVDRLMSHILVPETSVSDSLFSDTMLELFEEAGRNIEHLVRARKTSSFEYGTIFPRDWIESADLGEGDLSQETIDYMYQKSMEYVSEEGEGWHEEIIGEYKYKSQGSAHVDRKMIDIEPRYILGVERLSKDFLLKNENQLALKIIARYLIKNARDHDLIAFKRVEPRKGEYYKVGNWRDSETAFPGQTPPLAPYDVNCVFYPESLKVIAKYREYFGIADIEELENLMEKWEENKKRFIMSGSEDLLTYAIALYRPEQEQMDVAHLDEAYELFYGQASLEEAIGLAVKVLDEKFFFTPRGPILVAATDPRFNTGGYHGKVIWPKQSAYAVAGLTKQLKVGLAQGWPRPAIETMRGAIIQTCEASFRAFEELKAVPELYFYDGESGQAKFYTDQPLYEGQMSLIQLWSSVGCRRMMRDYVFVKKEESF